MSNTTEWKARPVFVVSTFQDMQEERNHLRDFVFPALEEKLKARRHHLEWIDLRIGMKGAATDNEETREAQILKVCLAEAMRSRPFLIALIGDRYGWVPPRERIEAAAREAGLSQSVTGRSVTDLEITLGALAAPSQSKRSLFYFRAPLPYAAMPRSIAATYSDEYATDADASDRTRKLGSLKERVKATFRDRWRAYDVRWDSGKNRITIPMEWSDRIVEDIWEQLSAEIPEVVDGAGETVQHHQRAALGDFAEDRARDFVGRSSILEEIAALLDSSTSDNGPIGLCLTGTPGSGKSALFGILYQALIGAEHNPSEPVSIARSGVRLRKAARDILVLGHAAGASPQSASVDSMIRRWIGELADFLNVAPGIDDKTDTESLDTAFSSLLHQATLQRRVIVLVDALDQFEQTPRGTYGMWLPAKWPANARLIATSTLGEASDALAKRPRISTKALPPLRIHEARQIVELISARYHRALEDDVTDALLANRAGRFHAWESPLWLVLATEQIHLVDNDSFTLFPRDYSAIEDGNKRMHALMRDMALHFPSNIADLYRLGFDRASARVGPALTAAFIRLIAFSRAGWRETDFRALLPQLSGDSWDGLRFASLRRLFRGQIRQSGAAVTWDFVHAQMRDAARAWCLDQGDEREVDLHRMVAEYLNSLPDDDLVACSEGFYHAMAAGEWALAAHRYAAFPSHDTDAATTILRAAIQRDAREHTPPNRSTIAMLIQAIPIDDRELHGFVNLLCAGPMSQLNDILSVEDQIATCDIIESRLNAAIRQAPNDPALTLALLNTINHRYRLHYALDDISSCQVLVGRLDELGMALVNLVGVKVERDANGVAHKLSGSMTGALNGFELISAVMSAVDAWLTPLRLEAEIRLKQGGGPTARKAVQAYADKARELYNDMPLPGVLNEHVKAQRMLVDDARLAGDTALEAEILSDVRSTVERYKLKTEGIPHQKTLLLAEEAEANIKLGNLGHASTLLRKAWDLAADIFIQNPTDPGDLALSLKVLMLRMTCEVTLGSSAAVTAIVEETKRVVGRSGAGCSAYFRSLKAVGLSELLQQYGRFMATHGKIEEASRAFNEAITLDRQAMPEADDDVKTALNNSICVGLAMWVKCLLEVGNNEEAIAGLKEALQQNDFIGNLGAQTPSILELLDKLTTAASGEPSSSRQRAILDVAARLSKALYAANPTTFTAWVVFDMLNRRRRFCATSWRFLQFVADSYVIVRFSTRIAKALVEADVNVDLREIVAGRMPDIPIKAE